MSQQELAARAGLRREKINRLESKGEDIGVDELCRLFDALGLELHVAKKGKAVSPAALRAQSDFRSNSSSQLAPEEFHKAAFIDGAKARVLNWGKVPK
jgi:transcriptional regulator with XRE-family HTH domain